MKNVICFLCLCFSLSVLHGQGWEHLYPMNQYDFFQNADLMPTPGGGFLIRTRVENNLPPNGPSTIIHYFYKIAPDGTLQWKKTTNEVLGAPAEAMCPGGGNRMVFVTVQNDTTRLVKTDANFQILWSQVLDAPGMVGYQVRLKQVNGGYVIMYVQNAHQGEPTRIIKTDINGNLLWQGSYPFAGASYLFHDFVTDEAGNLFVFGSGWVNNSNATVVHKLSPSGTILFEKTYTEPGAGFTPILLNDHLLAFMNYQKIFFIDGDGEPVNSVPAPYLTYRLAAMSDGNILVGTQGNTSKLYKVRPDGSVIWTREFQNLSADYDKAPFSMWSLPDGGTVSFFIPSSGTRPFYVVRTDANGQVYTNQVHGNIFADTDHDCSNTGVDFPAPGVTVVAQEGSDFYYATTDSFGNYDLTLDTGTYLLRVLPPGGAWEACTDSLTVTLGAYDTLEWNTGISSLLDCPWPGVDLSAIFLRRCTSSNYKVNYGNSSTVTADSAVVTLTLDPFLSLSTASLPFIHLGGNTYEFFIGDLTPLQTGSFNVEVQVDCAAALGQTHCSSAEIRISNPCPPSGLQTPVLQVQANCEGDSVAFNIHNNSGAAMTEAAEFVVIEDLIIMRQGQFQLPSQGETTIKCPANGKTSRIYAGQAPGEPPFFATTTAIEGCNGAIQPGLWNMFPSVIARQDVDEDCQPNIGSYDPNDKQAVPTGYDTEHYIGRNVPLDYKIRFQNTGTDTAFLVVIRDTLSPWLDASSIRAGAASHPYTWQLLGNGVVQFTFTNILLPDSTTNLAASQGFISFHIDQKTEVPLQTLIENQAAIFFDFNDPVLTNTTFHRVGEKFITVGAWEPSRSAVLLNASPNPFNSETRLEVKGLAGQGSMRLQVFDLQGKMVREMNSESGVFSVKKDALNSGIYLFNIEQNGVLVGRGKLVVQ